MHKIFLSLLFVSISIFSASSHAISRKSTDNIFFATPYEPIGFDPALGEAIESANIISNIFESLVKFNEDNTNIEPSLATKWDISEDNLTYTFYLKKGVKFHDNTPFNAEAVAFNIERQIGPNAKPNMPYAKVIYGDVASYKVIDDYTISITLKKVNTSFLSNLAIYFGAPIVSPTALKASDNNVSDNPIGTGPYKFFAYDRGQQVILTRFDDYHGTKAKTENIIIKTIPETVSRVVALNRGEVDIAFSIDANVIDEVTKNNNVVLKRDGMNTNYMFFNCEDGALTSDREIREAVAMCINTEELVSSLYKDYAQVANTFLPNFMQGYSKDVKYPQYNIEKAKEIFARKNVKELKIITYSTPRPANTLGGQVLAEAIQASLLKANVQTKIFVYDFATYRNKIKQDKFDIGFLLWTGDNGDSDNFLNLFASDDIVYNAPRFKNDEYKALIAKGLSTSDTKERALIYTEAEKLLAREVPILPISHAKQLVAVSSKLKDAKVHPIGLFLFSKAYK